MDFTWPVDDAEDTMVMQNVVQAAPQPLCAYCHSSRVTPSRVRWYDYWQGPLRGELPFRCHTCLRRFWLARIFVVSDRRSPRRDQERRYLARQSPSSAQHTPQLRAR